VYCNRSFVVAPKLALHYLLENLHHHKQLAIPRMRWNINSFSCNASNYYSLFHKKKSFANGHGGVSRRSRYVIVIKRHNIIGGLITLFLVFFLLCWRHLLHMRNHHLHLRMHSSCLFFLSFVNSALSFSSFFMSSSTVGVVEVSVIDAFSSSPNSGGGVIPYPPVLSIFSLSN
jgi:hypothetical protein